MSDLNIDIAQIYMEKPCKVNDWITIYQPTVGEIIDFGENTLYAAISPFTCNPTTFRLQLWDTGIDWNKISDFELFLTLYRQMTPKNTFLIFKDFDFSKLVPYKDNETGDIALYDENLNKVVTEKDYRYIAEYLRIMFNQRPKVEKAKGKATKEAIIDEERMNLQTKLSKKEYSSFLLPLISFLVNHPGFKYKKNELNEVGIFEFMDSVQRIQVNENVRALASGVYSGMLDTSKIDLKNELNWFKDLYN